MEIRMIFPKADIMDLDRLLNQLKESKSLPFFSPMVVNFCDSLGRALMQDPRSRTRQEVVALAFWLRKSNVLHLKNTYAQPPVGTVLIPRGTVFHISPANVDTIFLYSWVVSVLCGNKNIVRLSSRISPVTELIIEKFCEVINQNPEFDHLKTVTYFVTFGHEIEVLQKISSISDVRVVWGGDGTIANIRKSFLPARSIDIGFADRFSYGMLKSSTLVSLSNESLQDLVSSFYNDSYLFNQKACSSPRIIFWVGTKSDFDRASELFWNALLLFFKEKQPIVDPSTALFKIKNAYEWAIQGDGKVKVWGPELTTLDFNTMTSFQDAKNLNYGAGSFVNYQITDLNELPNIFGSKDQTIGYFGFEKTELNEFAVKINGQGIDRIVPMGQALAFGVIWDGFNFFETLSKKVVVL